jgi:hypothetical protein
MSNLYGCQIWKITRNTVNKSKNFINRHLLAILQIEGPLKVFYHALWDRAKQQPVETQIRERKWGWTGHTL